MVKTILIKTKKSKQHPKQLVPLSIIRDKRLTGLDMALILYLLTLPVNWTLKKDNVIREFIGRGETERAMNTAWKHLTKIGYIQHKNLGTYNGIQWYIYEIPTSVPYTCVPHTDV